jgi:hypothetical protein
MFLGSIMLVPTKGPQEIILILIGTSDPPSELSTISIGTFFILPTRGPQVQKFFFVRTSDPPSELSTIYLNLHIPVGQPPQTLTYSTSPLSKSWGKPRFNHGISLLWSSLYSPLFGTSDPHHLSLNLRGKSSRYFI